jgi:hypothetical protein
MAGESQPGGSTDVINKLAHILRQDVAHLSTQQLKDYLHAISETHASAEEDGEWVSPVRNT